MSKYDTLKSSKDSDPLDKLIALRSEMLTPISTIRGFATLIKKWLETEHEELPPDIAKGINKIIEESSGLQEILDILTYHSDKDDIS